MPGGGPGVSSKPLPFKEAAVQKCPGPRPQGITAKYRKRQLWAVRSPLLLRFTAWGRGGDEGPHGRQRTKGAPAQTFQVAPPWRGKCPFGTTIQGTAPHAQAFLPQGVVVLGLAAQGHWPGVPPNYPKCQSVLRRGF